MKFNFGEYVLKAIILLMIVMEIIVVYDFVETFKLKDQCTVPTEATLLDTRSCETHCRQHKITHTKYYGMYSYTIDGKEYTAASTVYYENAENVPSTYSILYDPADPYVCYFKEDSLPDMVVSLISVIIAFTIAEGGLAFYIKLEY